MFQWKKLYFILDAVRTMYVLSRFFSADLISKVCNSLGSWDDNNGSICATVFLNPWLAICMEIRPKILSMDWCTNFDGGDNELSASFMLLPFQGQSQDYHVRATTTELGNWRQNRKQKHPWCKKAGVGGARPAAYCYCSHFAIFWHFQKKKVKVSKYCHVQNGAAERKGSFFR